MPASALARSAPVAGSAATEQRVKAIATIRRIPTLPRAPGPCRDEGNTAEPSAWMSTGKNAGPSLSSRASDADPLHPLCGIPRASRRREDRRQGRQLAGSEAQLGRGGVLFQPLAAARAGDRHDVLSLGEQPGERDLRRRAVLRGGER